MLSTALTHELLRKLAEATGEPLQKVLERALWETTLGRAR
jgi:hypothetical protein